MFDLMIGLTKHHDLMEDSLACFNSCDLRTFSSRDLTVSNPSDHGISSITRCFSPQNRKGISTYLVCGGFKGSGNPNLLASTASVYVRRR